MIFNGSEKILNNGKDYLVLVDYGMEGISVGSQHETLAKALLWMHEAAYWSPMTIVKLVRVNIEEVDK